MGLVDALGYDDIALVPQYFDGVSRSSLNTSVMFGGMEFALPVVPANMKCVIDIDVAHKLQLHNYFYVMHRFDNDPVSILERMHDEKWRCKSISVGVKSEDYKLIDKIKADCIAPDFITVDIAHGHCKMMKDVVEHIKLALPDTFVIAGNVATPQACDDLVKWGADAVKVGVGPGKSCITRLKTGFYTPMFSTVRNICRKTYRCNAAAVPIIADGGVQHNGDVAKAIVAGASMVMVGSMFAQCDDSPAACVNGEKVYFGSASAQNKGHNKNVEGKQILMTSNGMTILEKMQEMQQDLQSAMSYAGGRLCQDTQYITVS